MPNNIIISNQSIQMDNHNRINLNALHRISLTNPNKRPSNWLRLASTKEIISELEQSSNMSFDFISKQKGGSGGSSTFAHELLAISYAGWISPKFQLQVNQAFLNAKRQTEVKHIATTDTDEQINIYKDKYIALLEAQVELLTPRKRKAFSDEEKNFIESMYGEWTVQNIAKKLNRNSSSIHNYLKARGFYG